jgi:hypothetical protein
MDQVVGQALATFRRLKTQIAARASTRPAIWTEAAE